MADALYLYLTHSHDEECEKCEEIFKGLLCIALMFLLNFRMKLDPEWRSKRWVKNIDLSSISIEGSALVTGKGVVVWEVENENGHVEVSEPLEINFHVGKSKRRALA